MVVAIMESQGRSRGNQRGLPGWPVLRLVLCLVFCLIGAGCGVLFSEPPALDQGDPALRTVNGVLLYAGAPLTGSVIERSDVLFRKTPFRKGLRHGEAQAWHPSGRLAYRRLFRYGQREGIHKGYWPSGQLQFEYRYVNDLFEGEQVGYYKTGQRAELRHYRKGQEEGVQKTWDAEGRLTSNYTVKEGRRYGLVGRFDCVSVH